MAGEELRGISEDTKDMLEGQVKKGKARKFILICKGASIKTLIVFKKGPYGPKIMKAKKEGFKGEAFCGVIVGKGVSLTMQLAGNSAVADAMKTEGSVSEGEPCKIAKLRQFFQEEGDLKFKPEFAIVTQVGDVVGVDESDDDNVVGESSENPPEEPPAENEATDAPASPDTKVASKLAAAIKQLKPLMEQVIAAQPDRKGDLVGQMTAIVQQVKASQFEDAKANIIEFGKLLKQLKSVLGAETKSSVGSSPGEQLNQRMLRLEPLLLEAKRAAPENASRFQSVWDFASAQLQSANYTKAEEALNRLEPKLREVIANAPKTDTARFGIEEGIVETTRAKLQESFRKSKLVWERTRGNLQAELKKLEQAILEASKEEEDFAQIQSNVGSIYGVMDVLDEELIEVLDECIACNDEQQQDSLHQDARELVKEYLDFAATEEFLSEVDQNPFAAVKVRSSLEASLKALDKVLQQRVMA